MPERRRGVALPGLPGLWTLEAVPGLVFPEPAAGLGQAFGRGGVLRAGPVVLRPYRRGGLVRHVNAGIYWGTARFQREFQVHQALWSAGLPTVEPLGWAWRRRLWGCEGVFLTRFAESRPWPRAWDQPGVLPQLRALLEALCAWGLHAPDLNATNVLVDASGAILTLDWDRAQWLPDGRLMDRYRERLVRSLRKLGAPRELIENA
jgi:RIO-like serine/threonine protein kinase